MYRIIIVDDEPDITDGLVEIVRNLQDLELDVYGFYSSKTAIGFMSENRVDIVITDIQMPGMDGLQFLSVVKEQWPLCKVIMLTGRTQFEYAYQTLQYEGVRFVLKAEGYAKLTQIIKELAKQLGDDIALRSANNRWLHQSYFRQDFWRRILLGQIPTGQMDGFFYREGLAYNQDEELLMLAGKMVISKQNPDYMDMANFTESVFSAMDSLIGKYACAQIIAERNLFVWLIKIDAENAPKQPPGIYLQGNVELCQKLLFENHGINMSFALDERPVLWGSLANRYESIKQMMDFSLTDKLGALITSSEIIGGTHDASDQYEPAFINTTALRFATDEMADCLEMGHKERYNEALDKLMGEMTAYGSMHSLGAQTIYLHIALMLLTHIGLRSLQIKLSFKLPLYKLTQYHYHNGWNEAAGYLRALSMEIFALDENAPIERTNNIINGIISYIEANISHHDGVTLVNIAKNVYLSPPYLSRVFKKEMGVTISEYITNMRVNMARKLLKDTSYKVNKVAAEVGYINAHNFARTFRKATGMSPQEYRNSVI